jgi:hypothetical protein
LEESYPSLEQELPLDQQNNQLPLDTKVLKTLQTHPPQTMTEMVKET